MSARTQIGVATVGIALGLIWLVISVRVAVGFTDSVGSEHRDASTTGLVTEVQQYAFHHAGQTEPLCNVVAEYTVDGVTYTRTSHDSGAAYCALVRGQSVPVRFDRRNPGDGYPTLSSGSSPRWPALVLPVAFVAVSVGIIGGCVRRIFVVRRAAA